MMFFRSDSTTTQDSFILRKKIIEFNNKHFNLNSKRAYKKTTMLTNTPLPMTSHTDPFSFLIGHFN